MTQTTALYRHFNIDGELLYVGISCSVFDRLSAHKQSDWFREIARVDITHYSSRNLAIAAERKAIRKEKPKYNMMHAGKKRPVTVTLELLQNLKAENERAHRLGQSIHPNAHYSDEKIRKFGRIYSSQNQR